MKNYEINHCERMGIDDGPIITQACMEAKKCIKDNNVLLHIVLIKYLKSILNNLFSGLGLIKTLVTILSFFIGIKIFLL